MSNELATTYKTACEKANIAPLQSILQLLSSSLPAYDLIVRGNDTINFHNRVTDISLQPIVTAYDKIISTIQIIDLRFNNLQDAGINVLSTVLAKCVNLKALNLKSNSIGVTGAKAIRKQLGELQNLESLDLSNNAIKTEGAMALFDLLIHPPSKFINFLYFNIGYNEIDHDGIISIASILNLNDTTLQELNLDSPIYNSVAQETCIHIGKMLASNNTIHSLSLQKHKIRCDGMYIIAEHLLENSSLQVLDLAANEIGVEGSTAIAKYLTCGKCVLNRLYMSSNRLGDLGAKAIAVAFESNKSLQTLTLNYNRINDIGLCYLAEGIETNTTLQCFTLFGNNFGQKSLALYNNLQEKRLDWVTDFKIYSVDSHWDVAKIEIGLK